MKGSKCGDKKGVNRVKNKKQYKKRKSNKTSKSCSTNLCVFTANAAGAKNKALSLKNELKSLGAGIFTLQETHYKKKGYFGLQDWEIFESIRKKEYGGTMIGVHQGLNPILIEEFSGDFELLIVEISISGKKVQIMSGYGPQECWPLDKRLPFFEALESSITKAGLAGKSILISLDANSKLGPAWIPNDIHAQSPNGKILAGILERHALVVANCLEGKSQGTVTRKRTTVDGIEKSTIDFVILSSDLVEYVVSVTTDEARDHCLTSCLKTNKGAKIVTSDHNTIITKLDMKCEKKEKKERVEIFNLKSESGQQKFKDITSKKGVLSDIFNDERMDIESMIKKVHEETQQNPSPML